MIGETLGSYKIISELGRGGMGIVYLGEHKLLGRKVALKLLREDVSERQTVVDRFFNEARAIGALKHPGIVEIYDFGYSDSGQAYFVMELLEGDSLQDRLGKSKTLPDGHVATISSHIANALVAAHDRGVIHRDLKPDNIFLVPDPERPGAEKIRLVDFGVAKLLADDFDADTTAAGVLIGTPSYMSPEQCRGEVVDGRSDLYALGCIMYRMVAGRTPFKGNQQKVIFAHAIEKPIPVHKFTPNVDSALASVVMRLLEKSPRKRPSTAEEVVDTLNQLLSSGRLESSTEGIARWGDTARISLEELHALTDETPTSEETPGDPSTAEQPSPKPTPKVQIDYDAVLTVSAPADTSEETTPDSPAAAELPRAVLSTPQFPVEEEDATEVLTSFQPRRAWLMPASLIAMAGLLIFIVAAFADDEPKLDESSPNVVMPDQPPSNDETGPGDPRPTVTKQDSFEMLDGDEDTEERKDAPVSDEVLEHFGDARKFLAAGHWAEARGSAKQALELAPDNETARKYDARARAEIENQLTFLSFKKAAKRGRHKDALELFDEIPYDSFYRSEATDRLNLLRSDYIEKAVGDARQLAKKNKCGGIKRLANRAGAVFPEARADVLAVKCAVSSAANNTAADKPGKLVFEKLDEDNPTFRRLVNQAKAAAKASQLDKALRLCEKALRIKRHNQEAIMVCAIASCKLKNHSKARKYISRLRVRHRASMARQLCLSQGVQIKETDD